MTGMLCCGTKTIINGMVLEVSADKLGASEVAGIDLGLPFEEKRRVFEGGKSNGRHST